jgi:hypothetical protein
MIIDLNLGQESLTQEGWDTNKTFAEQTLEVRNLAGKIASENFLKGDIISETGGGNTRPSVITYQKKDEEGIPLEICVYVITPEYYSSIADKSFMLTRRININVTLNNN